MKASGQLKKEGKNYVVQSGDVMHLNSTIRKVYRTLV